MLEQLDTLRRHWQRRRFPQQPDLAGVGRAPDYVGVGVQRAGTTRWHSLLAAHPDAAQVVDRSGNPVKELHWFRDPPSRGLSDQSGALYNSWFQAPLNKVVGEFTPRYMYDLWPLDQLRLLCPDTKLIVFLREPVSRLVSAMQFLEQRGTTVDRDTIREALGRGVYSTQLEYLFDIWPTEQVHVALFEDCNAEPWRQLKRLYEFVGLDSSFVPKGLEDRVNSSSSAHVDEALLKGARRLYAQDRPKLQSLLPDTDLARWD